MAAFFCAEASRRLNGAIESNTSRATIATRRARTTQPTIQYS